MAKLPVAQEMPVGVGTWKRVGALGASHRVVQLARRLASPQARARRCHRWGRLLTRWGRPGWALWMCRRATGLEGGNCGLWRQRAAAAMRAGALEEVAACYRALLRLQPDSPRAYWRLAMLYDLLGAAGAALEVCRHGLRRLPHAGCLHRQHAHLLLNSGSVRGALKAFEEAGALNHAHCETEYYVGPALRQAGRVEEARRALRKAMALRPDDPRLYYALGLCCKAAEAQESVGWLLQGLAAEQRQLYSDRTEGAGVSGQTSLQPARRR